MNDLNNLSVITTHVNPDYDALSSMIAINKIYPDAILLSPGLSERQDKNFFVQSIVYLANMKNLKDINLSQIKKLILVDTRQPSRIGPIAAILSKPDLDIHIYDHHPVQINDIKGSLEIIERTGATVSIICNIIKAKGLEISEEEATLFCAGIYEDTCSFASLSTTQTDFLAAAFLMSKGAKLDTVLDLTSNELTPDQTKLLGELTRSIHRYCIKGINIGVSCVTTENYVRDFAVLVHTMLKLEELSSIFAIAQMGTKIYVVARSKTPDVDVGLILKEFGGGGHTFAASANIKDKTLNQTEKELLYFLDSKIIPAKKAKDIMASPAIRVNANVSCREARVILNRHGINVLLVIDDNGKLVGYITRQILAKAVGLELGHAPVCDYMTPDPLSISSESELWEIQKAIMNGKQRVLPVVDNGQIKGVITRSDLLSEVIQQNISQDLKTQDFLNTESIARTRNINNLLKERLPENLLNLLKTAGRIASKHDFQAYIVGGFVRDLLLNVPNEDIDIVIEGEGILFAKELIKIEPAKIHSHEKFGTATLVFQNESKNLKNFKIDIASARMEYYRFPADFPNVEMSCIKLDMYRRDFTINTLAASLNPEKFGLIIDFFSAQKDIKDKSIRVLHNLSFIEDPTRVFRAIRFEQRFEFTLEKLTESLIKNVVKLNFLKQLSGKRVFKEICLILQEENPIFPIRRLNDYGLLSVVHESISFNLKLISLFESIKKVLSWFDLLFTKENCQKWLIYFMALTQKCSKEACEEICSKFEFNTDLFFMVSKEKFEAEQALFWFAGHLENLKNSIIYKNLSKFKIESILYIMALANQDKLKKMLAEYITHLRFTKISISGKDLMKMGMKPSPAFKELLDAALYAKLDGLLKTRNDELLFVKNYAN